MVRIGTLSAVLFAGAVAGLPRASAHPQKPNASITATTVAELTVNGGEVRLVLEIGDGDRNVFRVLESAADTEERRQFLTRDLVVRADERVLMPRIAAVERRPRKKRDAITGEVIPGPELGAETVTSIDLRYTLADRPKQLTILPPRGPDGPRATIGLAATHLGVPVNDFDFLNFRETLQLDWNDPWNSRFRSPRLKRSQNSPLSVFVYTDRREVRIEVVMRLRTLLEWKGRGLAERAIPAARQEEFCSNAGEFLRGQLRLAIDGTMETPILDHVQLLKLTLGKVEPDPLTGEIPIATAVVGALFVYPVDGRPRELRVGWNAFGGRIAEIPCVINNDFDVKLLTAANSEATWLNPHPERDGDLNQLASPARPIWHLPSFSIAAALVGLLALFRTAGRAEGRPRYIRIALCLAIAAYCLLPFGQFTIADPFAPEPKIDDEPGRQIVGKLLENVYHAFDYRSEEAVYDTLAKSVSGDLLRQTYLDARRALDLRESGIRAQVQAVNVESASIVPDSEGEGFVARCRWTVDASVTHWGHTHRRSNRYEGEMTVRPEGGRWRIGAMRMLEEQPLRAEATPSPIDTRRAR